MKFKQRASKKPEKFFRIILHDIVIKVVDISAQTKEQAIRHALDKPTWSLHQIDRTTKVAGILEMDDDEAAEYVQQSDDHSPLQHAEGQ